MDVKNKRHRIVHKEAKPMIAHVTTTKDHSHYIETSALAKSKSGTNLYNPTKKQT